MVTSTAFVALIAAAVGHRVTAMDAPEQVLDE